EQCFRANVEKLLNSQEQITRRGIVDRQHWQFKFGHIFVQCVCAAIALTKRSVNLYWCLVISERSCHRATPSVCRVIWRSRSRGEIFPAFHAWASLRALLFHLDEELNDILQVQRLISNAIPDQKIQSTMQKPQGFEECLDGDAC